MTGENESPLRIIETIAAGDYETFGMFLLQDDNGVKVRLLKKDHIHEGVMGITQAIMQKWLTSDVPTHTYEHLIQCLKQSGQVALAERVTSAVGKNNMQYTCIAYTIKAHMC